MNDNGAAEAGQNVVLDAEGKRLQLEAAKAKYASDIASAEKTTSEARFAPLRAFLPTISDAPKGQVTLGDKAGAFGPWRAHHIVDVIADEIAGAVRKHISGKGTREPRVLVVDDRVLFEGDWTARQVRSALTRLSRLISTLQEEIAKVDAELEQSIGALPAEDDQDAPALDQVVAPEIAATTSRRRSGKPKQAAPDVETAREPAVAATLPGALGAAIDMLGLIHTDYTVTASAVTTTPSELATLVAAHLSSKGDTAVGVEADVFTTVHAASVLKDLDALLAARDDAVTALSRLLRRLSPLEEQLAVLETRTTAVEQEWITAAGDDTQPVRAPALYRRAEVLLRRALRRRAAAAPARSLVSHARQVMADVDAAVAGLTKAPDGGHAPVVLAARYERLAAVQGTPRITHVLYVSLDNLAADTVTRRSLFGASGVLRFLSAGNGSWLLLDTASGTIEAGGQRAGVDAVTFSLECGAASYGLGTGAGIKDPLSSVERWAKVVVVLLVLVLLVLAFVSFWAVIKVALK